MKKKREERKKREQRSDDYISGELLPPEGDQVLTVDDVRLYDEPTSLSLVPKKSGTVIPRMKEEVEDDRERL